MRTSPPCQNTRIRAFIAGDQAPAHSVRAAVKVCQSCPLRRGCALAAMTAGDTLDGGVQRPAAGVVQAGVVCHGDRWTLRALAAVAGVPVPEGRTRTGKSRTLSNCRGCDQPMHPWTRTPEDIPEGMVMHRGRSYCVHCRTAYQRDLEQYGRRRQGLHKVIDRLHHHDTTRTAREAQQALRQAARDGFDVTTREAAELAGVSASTINTRVRDDLLPTWTAKGVRGYRYRSADVAQAFGVQGPVTTEGVFISPQIPPRIDGNVRTSMATEHHEAA